MEPGASRAHGTRSGRAASGPPARAARWGLALLALLALGCGGPRLAVLVDEPARTGWGAGSPTWAWDAPPRVDAPRGTSDEVRTALADGVSRALGAHGFVHGAERPDVRVRVRLEVQRRRIVSLEQRPPRAITGSLVQGQYVVSGVTRVEREVDDLRLELELVRADDGLALWKARLRERLPERFEPHLASLVAGLFARFPPAPSTAARVAPDDAPAPEDAAPAPPATPRR